MWKFHFSHYYSTSFLSSIISENKPLLPQVIKLSKREKNAPKLDKRLYGHFNRVLSMEWAQDGIHLVSLGARDGQLLLTSSETGKTVCRFPMRSSSQMSCAISPSGKKQCTSF